MFRRPNGPAPLEFKVGFKLTKVLKLTGSLTGGLTKGAADWGSPRTRATLLTVNRLDNPSLGIIIPHARHPPIAWRSPTMGQFNRLMPLMFLALLILPAQAAAWIRTPAATFATLPAGSGGPEGITADAEGNIYASSFGFTAAGSVSGPGQVFVFDQSGRLLRQLSLLIGGTTPSSPHLLGLRFHPTTGALLVLDFGARQVLKVDPFTGVSTVFMTLPTTLPHPALGAGLNDLTFDSAGNVYVSDSFQGVVWRVGPTGGIAAAWVDSPLLRTTGVPPFGANGLRFNNEQTALFVANTGNRTVVKIPVSGLPLTAGTPAVFVNSIGGADGLLIDDQDNIWVAANQDDEIVIIDATGRVIAKLADFQGLSPDGAVKGLLFPASLVFSGEFLYVTNLALDLRLFGITEAVDSQWAAQVTQYTLSKIPARIPPIEGTPEP